MTDTLPGVDLQQFIVPYLMGALGRLQPVTNQLVFFFSVIAIVLMGVRYAASNESHLESLKWLVPQLATMIGLVWLATHIGDFAFVIHTSLTMAGMISGGFNEATTPLYNPLYMFRIATRVFEIMMNSCGVLDFINPIVVFAFIFAALCVIVSGLALFLFALIKIYHFKAVVIAGCLMIPPGLWPRTATIAEDWFTHVFNGGMSMFMLAVCLSLPLPFFEGLSKLPGMSCSALSFLWIGAGFAAWTVVTISLTQSFSRMISKVISLYGAK